MRLAVTTGALRYSTYQKAPDVERITGEMPYRNHMRIKTTIAGSAVLCAAGAVMLAQTAQSSTAYAGKPYQGRPQAIPGRIQAEFYDTGGEGVAYHDSDAGNNGSGKLNPGPSALDRFRKDEDVDISYTKLEFDKTMDGQAEALGELYVGWTAPGEWIKYTVDVKQPGVYTVDAHLSSNNQNAEISLEFDGVDVSGPIVIPTTGHWHRWRICRNMADLKLDKGIHIMTLKFVKEGNMNIDYLEFFPKNGAR